MIVQKERYNLAIEITYTLSGELLKEYLDQLGDYEDTEEQRKEFLVDRFAPANWKGILDPKAELVVRKVS